MIVYTPFLSIFTMKGLDFIRTLITTFFVYDTFSVQKIHTLRFQDYKLPFLLQLYI
ncbi:hypothetical protein JCM21531_4282 [Acetivibrio straminisolvens JCM 21531]|uniref:Uncharacterized protein n=1 Tax=Acetivibrio straminisolvens JCM 21531 TaxID=1294263 RepID=W4VCY2_9FIRM|nr:hypothetical protein JCM21531_4282 [Acetivibrio straminisolvens JCM 21531]